MTMIPIKPRPPGLFSGLLDKDSADDWHEHQSLQREINERAAKVVDLHEWRRARGSETLH